MNFVFISDTHLKTFTWTKRVQIARDSYCSFLQACDFCAAQKLPLFLGGDILDSSFPDSEAVEVLKAGLRRVQDVGGTVYAIQGQHDESNPPWPGAILDKIRHVNRKAFKLGSVPCWAMDMHAKTEAEKAVLEIPEGTRVVFLHQLIRQVFSLDEKWDFDLDWLPDSVEMVLAGDYHETIDTVYTRKSGKPVRLVYNGSTHMCKIDEVPAKSFCLVDLSVDPVFVERIPLRTRPYLFYEAQDEESLGRLLDDIAAGLLTDARDSAGITDAIYRSVAVPVLHVEFSATIERADERLRAAVGDFGYLWTKPVFTAPEPVESDLQLPEDKGDGVDIPLADCLKVVCNEDTDAFAFVLDTLQREPDTVFRAWREKYNVSELLTTGTPHVTIS